MITAIEHRSNARTDSLCIRATCRSLAQLELVLQVLASVPWNRIYDHQISADDARFAACIPGCRHDDVARRHELRDLIGVAEWVQPRKGASKTAQPKL